MAAASTLPPGPTAATVKMKDPRTSSLHKSASKQPASDSTTLAGGRKRKRAHHNKVKTGCFTCRKRHVKCDEGKPFCRICTKNGYKCGGYSTIDSVKLVVVPSPRTLHGRDEHQAFQFFMETTMTWFTEQDGPCMSEYHVNEFWNPVVVQITESEPAIKHILLAWAELHRRILYEPVSGDEPIENDFFWQNHSQALRLLGSKKQVDTSVMLIACIMFCILERFRGRRDIFLKHLQSGLRILQHYDETPTHLRASICDSMIARYVRPILTAFRLNLSNMVDHDSLQPREKTADRLVKMEQASRALKTWN